jgi:hypothetical protein
VSDADSLSHFVGPILLLAFMCVISIGCCMACAATEPRAKRRAAMRAAGATEITPLMPKTGAGVVQRGGVAPLLSSPVLAPPPPAPA